MRVKVNVVYDDGVGGGEVDADATGTCGEEKDKYGRSVVVLVNNQLSGKG